MKKTPVPRTAFEEFRKNKGTQDKVAVHLGISETHLRNLEKGRSDPSTDLLFLSAYYFGASVYQVWPDIAKRTLDQLEDLKSRST